MNFRPLIFALLLAGLASARAATAVWEKLPPLPEPNGGFIAGAVGRDVLIAGGTKWENDTKSWLRRICLFESRKREWRVIGELPEPRAYTACGPTDEGVWFAGGSNGQQPVDTLCRLDPDGRMHRIAANQPAVVSCGSAVLDGELWVIAGTGDQGKGEALTNACSVIDLRTGKARRIADLPTPGIVSAGAAACGGRVYVFGGASFDAASGSYLNRDSVFVWSAKEACWEKVATYPFVARGIAAVALDGTHVFVAGGYKNDQEEFTDAAFIFDTRKKEFRKTIALPCRAMTTLVKAGDHVYCLGGEDQKKHRTAAAWCMAPPALLQSAGL